MEAYFKDSNYDNMVLYDCSGSTGKSLSGASCYLYHSQTQEIVKYLDSSKTLFVRWDHEFKVISKVDLEEINKDKKGFGGTNPISVFKYIKNIGFKGNIHFISDGQIEQSIVKECSEIFSGLKFNSVKIHLICTGGNINESVSCALTRGSPHEIKNYKDDTSITVTEEDFQSTYSLDSISTIDEFLSRKKTMENVLISINMGTSGNKILHQKLVALKNRLVKSKSKKFATNTDNPVARLIDSFETSNPSMDEVDNVWKVYYKIEEPVDGINETWEQTVDKFISWCSGSLLSTFDRTKTSNREVKAEVKVIIPSESVDVIEEKPSDLKLTCPITLSDTSNMIILMKRNGSSIFANLPTNVRDSLINCPLNALRNHDILMYIKSLLDCVISIEAYKELVEYGISDKSPLTRDEIFGGLCLGKDISHVQATNSTLRHVLTGGKSLGNMDLWFVVIYFIVERGHAEHLRDYLPLIKEHLRFRLLKSNSYMCLSGLPTYPVYSVPIGLAMWCSVMATTSKLSLMTDPKNDPIRLHLSYALDIIELLDLINISIPRKLLEHINRLKTLRTFLLEVKKGQAQKIKLKNLIHALTYNAIETSDMWVLIDGKPSDEQIYKVRTKLPSVCKDLSIPEINGIIKLCDTNKSEGDIYIPYNYSAEPYVKTTTKKWSFGIDVPYYIVVISPNTCRPLYNIIDDDKNKIWIDKAIEVHGNDLFSTNNFFGKFVSENKKYPTKHEFLEYIFMYHFERGNNTLPICIQQFVNIAFIEYQEIMNTITPEEFAIRFERSVAVKNRIYIEKFTHEMILHYQKIMDTKTPKEFNELWEEKTRKSVKTV